MIFCNFYNSSRTLIFGAKPRTPIRSSTIVKLSYIDKVFPIETRIWVPIMDMRLISSEELNTSFLKCYTSCAKTKDMDWSFKY